MAKRTHPKDIGPIQAGAMLVMFVMGIWSICGVIAYLTIPPVDPYHRLTSAFVYFPAVVIGSILVLILVFAGAGALIGLIFPSKVKPLPKNTFTKYVKPYFVERMKPAFEIQAIGTSNRASLYSSKLGGTPYWPQGKDYPTNHKHEKLRLLAQINVADLPHNEYLPKTGLLQFFITQAHMYGYSDSPSQKGYSVVYHQNTKIPQTSEIILTLDTDDDTSPLIKETPILFKEYSEAPASYGTMTPQIVNDFLAETDDPDEFLREKGIPIAKPISKLFGHMTPIQFEPRGIPTVDSDVILLLQLLSEDDLGACIWGDMGGGYFLISKEDLAQLKFEKAYYTWDCY